MARISLNPPSSLRYRLTEWYAKRTYGRVMDPLKAAGHHPRVLWGQARLEMSVARWNSLDADLKALAVMASAASIGCSWCMDFGHWENHERGMDPRKLHDLPQWRQSEAYTDLERDVMEYAEGVTANPPDVADDLAERLVRRLGEPAFVELTAMIAVENLRSRFNAAMGLTSQGFKDSCDLAATPGPPTDAHRSPH